MPFPTPTENELQVVSSLRGRLTTEFNESLSPKITDVTILRFLRGLKQNEDDAFERLKGYQLWRVENQVDNCIVANTDRFQKYIDKGLGYVKGKDFNGRPLGFGVARLHNAYDRDVEELRLMIIYVLELMLQNSIPSEERFVIVFDLFGFSLKCMDYELTKVLIYILQTHYPDTLEKVYIIDAPFVFWACWAIIKPWLGMLFIVAFISLCLPVAFVSLVIFSILFAFIDRSCYSRKSNFCETK
jgi:hypothetical protein